MASKHIEFDPDLLHAVSFRHGPRIHAPKEKGGYNVTPPNPGVWAYDDGLDEDKDRAIAKRTIQVHFGKQEPAVQHSSPLQRAVKTLKNRWPNRSDDVKEVVELGIARGDEREWVKIDALPNPYDAHPRTYLEVDPDLMLRHGRNVISANLNGALLAGVGKFVATCTHYGHLDTALYLMLLSLGITDANSLFPCTASGSFVHFAWTPWLGHKPGWEPTHDMSVPWQPRPVYCRYYPVPA